MQSITVLLFSATTFVWIALVCLKAWIWGLDGRALAEDIISNILGILPPMIIFNFLYEYLTKEHVSKEMAEQITSTLMGKPEVMNAFEDEQKTTFINTTIEAMVGTESYEMVSAVITPYITNQYNIRTFYKYSIILRDYVDNSLFPSDKYMKIYENLKYTKKYINSGNITNEFSIAFISQNHELDSALRTQTYIFQENLSIDDTEMQILLKKNDDEKLSFVEKEMQVTVYIDEHKAEIKSLNFSENGINIEFSSKHDNSANIHTIEISFAMPQRKGHSEFFASVNEPTYSPMIQLSYPESTMNVKAFSFLNDGDDSSVEKSIHSIGNYEFCIQNKWIYPMSGVVFIIDDID